jgi:hypothetical protein
MKMRASFFVFPQLQPRVERDRAAPSSYRKSEKSAVCVRAKNFDAASPQRFKYGASSARSAGLRRSLADCA